ncbi:MAG: hypothetical protein ACTSVZ_01430 [Promethearchaeota archaeon]
MMKIAQWFTKEECIAAMKEYTARFEAKDLDGLKDAFFYFKATFGCIYTSQGLDEDDDKYELWENLADNLEEYESIAYFVEIRGEGGPRITFFLSEGEQKLGVWEGEWDKDAAKEAVEAKNYVWMDWTPATQLQIMSGNPNTDAQFFSGDLKVDGSLKLASMPRQLGYDFFEFLDIEID